MIIFQQKGNNINNNTPNNFTLLLFLYMINTPFQEVLNRASFFMLNTTQIV